MASDGIRDGLEVHPGARLNDGVDKAHELRVRSVGVAHGGGNQHIACAQPGKAGLQAGAVIAPAGHLVLMQVALIHAGGQQCVELRIVTAAQ